MVLSRAIDDRRLADDLRAAARHQALTTSGCEEQVCSRFDSLAVSEFA